MWLFTVADDWQQIGLTLGHSGVTFAMRKLMARSAQSQALWHQVGQKEGDTYQTDARTRGQTKGWTKARTDEPDTRTNTRTD